MTVVNTAAGEIVEPVSLEQAKRITEQIKLLAGAVADGIDRLVVRIREAQESRVHEVLGYRSWTEYVSVEFAGLLPRLDREPRRELVTTLADSGMSTRAIAPIVGVSQRTAARDMSGSSESNGSDEPRRVESRDGVVRTFPTRPAPEPTPTPDEEFWNKAAKQAAESGYLDRQAAEKPYLDAVITLGYAAEDIASVPFDASALARNLPAVGLDRLPAIEAAASWLADFIAATKEIA